MRHKGIHSFVLLAVILAFLPLPLQWLTQRLLVLSIMNRSYVLEAVTLVLLSLYIYISSSYTISVAGCSVNVGTRALLHGFRDTAEIYLASTISALVIYIAGIVNPSQGLTARLIAVYWLVAINFAALVRGIMRCYVSKQMFSILQLTMLIPIILFVSAILLLPFIIASFQCTSCIKEILVSPIPMKVAFHIDVGIRILCISCVGYLLRLAVILILFFA